jgi:isochorismate synthase
MGDIINYRIPGKVSRCKSGSFAAVSATESVNGFVVRPFSGDEIFQFIESSDSPQNITGSIRTEDVPIYSQEEYFDLANAYLSNFSNRGVDKAILSRIKKISFNHSFNSLYNALCEEYPNAFVYLISSHRFGTWIGATPEVLLQAKGEIGFTMSLAGTKESGKGIEWTEKERSEQHFVSEFIEKNLDQINCKIISKKGPESVMAGPVEHLRTDFKFKFPSRKIDDFVELMHPTPAVCGAPRMGAFEMIRELECHDRGLYAGFIGVVGEETNLYVNLRCAQLFAEECFLYIGGGLTIDSNPHSEWLETENKAKTLLNVIEKL